MFFKLLSLIQFSSKSSSVYFWGKFSTFTLAMSFESFESHYISAHQISKQSKEPMKNPPFILIAIHLHENIIQGFCCLYLDGLGEDHLNPATTGNSDSPCLHIWGLPSCLRYLYGSKEYFGSSLHNQTLCYRQVRCLWSLLQVYSYNYIVNKHYRIFV